jgi:hypothetical protein
MEKIQIYAIYEYTGAGDEILSIGYKDDMEYQLNNDYDNSMNDLKVGIISKKELQECRDYLHISAGYDFEDIDKLINEAI